MIKYICGPIAGHPDLNESAFREAMSTIAAGGDGPLVPLDIEPHWHMGDCAPVYGSPAIEGGHDGGCYLRADIAEFLRAADVVHCLPGWSRSRGAQIEVLIARLLRIPIEYAPGAETGGSAVVALADVADAMLRLDGAVERCGS